MKTGKEYVEDIKRLRPVIYFDGEIVSDYLSHPVFKQMINVAKATYDFALEEENKDRMIVKSILTDKSCNLLSALFTKKEDLVKTVKLRRWWQNQTGTCSAGRCAGTCVANAIFNGSYLVDKDCGTDYHERFKEFYKKIHQEDEICAAGVMCIKGDRSKGPLEQNDKDLYLRVIEKNSKGIIVRGAKAHQSNGALAHEILVIPFRPMKENEKDYAVSFAVSNNTKGLVHIWQHNLHDSRQLIGKDIDLGNSTYGSEYHGTCLTIFDDVFVPWERVFLCGEYHYTSNYVNKFADLIRLCGGGCRTGAVDLAIGVMSLLAEYNGVEKAGHIIEKLTNLSAMNELSFGSALAAANEGENTDSSIFFPSSLYANAARLNGTNAFAEANKMIGDIAGGLIATMPSEKDFSNEDTARFLNKYLQTKNGVKVEHRIRAFRFAEMLGSGPALHGLLCGGGTPETQKMVIRNNLNLEEKKCFVKKLSKIDD